MLALMDYNIILYNSIEPNLAESKRIILHYLNKYILKISPPIQLINRKPSLT